MAYGAIPAPLELVALPKLSFSLPSKRKLYLFPLTRATAPPGIIDYLHGVLNSEIEEGLTYPQEEPLSLEAFASYYFGATTIVGVVSAEEMPEVMDASVFTEDIETVRAGREWKDCIGGSVYIKPNYPGRSSHNCNGGFLITRTLRNNRLGYTLGKSFLIYAPLLGYRASVFNLVYKTNVASLAIWDRLGFSRVGLIPEAGRLKSGPGGAEEYVDAVVIYKKFDQKPGP